MFGLSLPTLQVQRDLYFKVNIETNRDNQQVLSLKNVPHQLDYVLSQPKSSIVFIIAEDLWKKGQHTLVKQFLDNIFKPFHDVTLEEKLSGIEERCNPVEISVIIDQWKLNFDYDYAAGLSKLHLSLDKTMKDLGYGKDTDQSQNPEANPVPAIIFTQQALDDLAKVAANPVPEAQTQVTAAPQAVVVEGVLTEDQKQVIKSLAISQFFKKAQLKKTAPATRELFYKFMTDERIEAAYKEADASLADAGALLAAMVINCLKSSEDTMSAMRKFNIWNNVVQAEKNLMAQEVETSSDVSTAEPAAVSSVREAASTVAKQRRPRPIA